MGFEHWPAYCVALTDKKIFYSRSAFFLFRNINGKQQPDRVTLQNSGCNGPWTSMPSRGGKGYYLGGSLRTKPSIGLYQG